MTNFEQKTADRSRKSQRFPPDCALRRLDCALAPINVAGAEHWNKGRIPGIECRGMGTAAPQTRFDTQGLILKGWRPKVKCVPSSLLSLV
jgi:hypothetical protein